MKNASLELLHNSQLVENLLTGLQDGLAIINPDGQHLFVNDAFCQLTGFSRNELLGASTTFPYVPTAGIPAINHALQRTVRGEKTTFELRFCTKHGHCFPVLFSPSQLLGANEKTIALVATVKDMSERKKLEQAAMESEQRWRSIAENPFDFVVVIDRSYRYQYVNHAAPGIRIEDLIGKATPFDFIPPVYHPVIREAYDCAFAGRAASYDVYVELFDKWYATIVGPIRENGTINTISLLTRDITEQKKAEETLRKAELQLRENHKTETIGTLASGIAHDLNNTLTPILAYAEMALVNVSDHEQLQHKLRLIHQAALRARDLVQRVLLFSRQQLPKKQTLDVVALVRESSTFFSATAPPSIAIELDLPDTPHWISADKTQIDQVLANLATNALHAMRERGTLLRIAVYGQKSMPTSAATGAHADAVVLSVSDNGIGMDEDTKRRAFDPFFTTKPLGTGTGLGLSIVQGIIREHGGEVHIDSSPGAGTTCTISLPSVPPPTSTVERPTVPTARGQKSLRILCVDDEPLVAKVVQALCTQHGHQVTVLNNGQAALALIATNADAFDVLLTDFAMPHMDGTELIRQVRSTIPTLPCVIMTGLDDDHIDQEKHGTNAHVLTKPFTVEALLAALQNV